MRRNLFLYLTIACFIAIMAIVIFGGYLGVFDTLYITTGGNQQTITPALFYRDSADQLNVQATWGNKISFVYELENRQFSPYETRVEVTLWSERQPGPLVLFSHDENIASFEKLKMGWTIDPVELKSRGFTEGLYTVNIQRKGLGRKIPVSYFSYPQKPPYPVPVPATP